MSLHDRREKNKHKDKNKEENRRKNRRRVGRGRRQTRNRRIIGRETVAEHGTCREAVCLSSGICLQNERKEDG
jgi:hypothetical protein